MVFIASRLENSRDEGLGNGSSDKVQAAVGLKSGEESISVQTERSIYLGHLGSDALACSSLSLSAVLSLVTFRSTLVTDMQSPAVLFLLVAFTVIPLVARFISLPILSFLSFPSAIIL